MLQRPNPSTPDDSESSNAPSELHSENCLHQQFERMVVSTPDAMALEFDGRTVSYRELDRRANALAGALRSLHVGPEQRVGILMPRGVEMIVAMLGVLKAGGAYVPLDPNYPRQRLQFMADDAELSVLLTTESTPDDALLKVDDVIRLDKEGAVLCKKTRSAAEGKRSFEKANSHNAAYVIYTSGSAGQPKGVIVEHHAVCNLTTSQNRALAIGPNDRVLQLASSSFDVSVWEIFTALTSGATLCLAAAEQLLPGATLIETLKRLRITVAAFPASLLSALSASELPDLRTIVVGGERCSAELAARWSKGRQFVNHYGPTEATVCATMHFCQAGEGDPPIGQPLENVEIYLLDEHQSPVAPGQVGEIYLAGAGLARGYLKRPRLTEQRFLIGVLAEEPNKRLYRSGDLAKHRDNGDIEFVGRVDDQIKLRGFRIELGEIEAAIMNAAHDLAIQQAAVVVREDAPGVRRLAAYCSAPDPVDTEELKCRLEAALPGHMIPSVFVSLPSMPLTANGKLDRAKLAALDALPATALDSTLKQGQDPAELQLAEIWCDVLGLDEVGVREHFVELGGDSLLSVEVASRASQAGLPLQPNDVLAHPTIAELAVFAKSSY